MDHGPSSSGPNVLHSPVSKTPKKNVTWSPHHWDGMSTRDVAFKVPESPENPQRLKPGSSLRGLVETTPRNIYRTPEKQSEVDRCGGVSSQRFFDLQEHNPSVEPGSPGPPRGRNTRSGRSPGRSRAPPLAPKDAVRSPATDQGVGTRSGSRVPSAEDLDSSGPFSSEVPLERSQTSDGGSGSSQLNSTSTDDDSLDIVEAAVTKTQFTGGLKMNISFLRRNSQLEVLVSNVAPPEAPGRNPGRSYGFRQTPDRQQREAAARLGYGSQPPRSSTPRSSAGPHGEAGVADLRSYQVETETQAPGVPKLKLKRADATSAADLGAPKAVCAHTPAKNTPGQGLQTFICQSYTPTAPPVAGAESVPRTPSPQWSGGVGKTPPDHLNSWPRRKRAGAAGGKERAPVGAGEEAELGVRRLQDLEEVHPAASTSPPAARDFYWMDQLSGADAQAGEAAPHDPRAGEGGS